MLRKVFTRPEALKRGETTEGVTKDAAASFGRLADGLRGRGVPAERAAHFLMKLMFCMFAEDIELLPERLFTRVLAGAKRDPVAAGPAAGRVVRGDGDGRQTEEDYSPAAVNVEPAVRLDGMASHQEWVQALDAVIASSPAGDCQQQVESIDSSSVVLAGAAWLGLLAVGSAAQATRRRRS